MACPAAGEISADNLVERDFLGSSAVKESTYSAGDPSLIPWIGKFHWRRERVPIPVFLGFPGGSGGKESTCNVAGLGSIPWRRRWVLTPVFCPGEFHGLVHGVAKSQTQLSN